MKKRFVWVLMAAVWLLGSFSPAAAHRPERAEAGGVTDVPDLTTSYAYYQAITEPEQVDVYRFQGKAGQFFHAGINIPKIEGLEGYGVRLALLGPDLGPLPDGALPKAGAHEDADDDSHAHATEKLVELGVETETGIVVESERTAGFFEPFTLTRYWGRQTLELELPASGTYHLLVWQPEGQPGKYVLDTGTEEVFAAADLLSLPLWWVNVHIYFGHTPYLVAGAVGLLAVAGIAVVARRRRR